MSNIIINNKIINDDSPAYVIAEIGHNHEGDIKKAKTMFKLAAASGASAVKLQKRDNKNLFTKKMFNKPYQGAASFGNTYGKHREFLEFNKDNYYDLFSYANKLGIDFFTTAFDENSIDFIIDIDLPAIKIASGDLTNIPLLKYASTTGKPLIISTGGGSINDIKKAYYVLKKTGVSFAFLQCTAIYPAQANQLNLLVIKTLKSMFKDIVIGYSGHDTLSQTPITAYTLGARIFERHFTLDKSAPGSDNKFSQTPDDLQSMIKDLTITREMLGSPVKRQLSEEIVSLNKMAKTLVTTKSLPKGAILTKKNITSKTSGEFGIRPNILNKIIGSKLNNNVKKEHVLTVADICFNNSKN